MHPIMLIHLYFMLEGEALTHFGIVDTTISIQESYLIKDFICFLWVVESESEESRVFGVYFQGTLPRALLRLWQVKF